jgi:hypothetical protein
MLLTINIAPWSDVIIVDAEGSPFPRFPTLGAEAIPFFVVGSAAGAVAVICARTVVVRPASGESQRRVRAACGPAECDAIPSVTKWCSTDAVWSNPKLGLGPYEAAPLAAFVIEFLYGIFCWYIYKGGVGLFTLISLGNLANLSFLSPAIPGPEAYLAGRPLLLVTVIFVQIVVTLIFVGVLARRHTTESSEASGFRRRVARRVVS